MSFQNYLYSQKEMSWFCGGQKNQFKESDLFPGLIPWSSKFVPWAKSLSEPQNLRPHPDLLNQNGSVN